MNGRFEDGLGPSGSWGARASQASRCPGSGAAKSGLAVVPSTGFRGKDGARALGQAFEEIARRWQAWWLGRRQRVAQAIWRCLSLVVMTSALAVLFGILKLVRGVPPLAWGCGAAIAAGLFLLTIPGVESPGPTAPPSLPLPSPLHAEAVPSPEAHGAGASSVGHPPASHGEAGASLHQEGHAAHSEHGTAEHGSPEHGPGHHGEAESEENAAVAAQGLSVFATVGEAVLDQFGESLGFFEIGEKLNGVFVPLKSGDTNTAVSKGAGAATEYSLAVYLVDAFEIMALIGSGMMFETVAGIAGSMAIVRSSAAAGEKVEETTHRSLTSQH